MYYKSLDSRHIRIIKLHPSCPHTLIRPRTISPPIFMIITSLLIIMCQNFATVADLDVLEETLDVSDNGRHIYHPLLGRIWILTSRVSILILCAWKAKRTASARIIRTQECLRTASIVHFYDILPHKPRLTVGGIRERRDNGKTKEDRWMHFHWRSVETF